MDRRPYDVVASPQQLAEASEPTVAISTHDAGRIVVLGGEHDLATLPALESALHQTTGGGVVIDLSPCTYVDCATIGAIARSASSSGLAIFAADTTAPIVRRLLEILDVPPARARRPGDTATNGHAGHEEPWTPLLRVLFQGAPFDAGLLYVLSDAVDVPSDPANGRGGRRPTGAASSRQDAGDDQPSTPPAALMLRAADARRQAAEHRVSRPPRVAR